MGLQKSAPLKAAGALERFQRLGKACGIGQTDADAAFSLTAVRRTGATKLMDKLGVIKTQMQVPFPSRGRRQMLMNPCTSY